MADEQGTGGNITPNADVQQEGSPQHNPLLGPESPTIPQGLEKFVGQDGSIDPSKLGQSYLEAEKAMTASRTENAELRQALTSLAERLEQGTNSHSNSQSEASSEDVDDALRRFAENPQKFIQDVAKGTMKELGDPLAQQISLATLQQMHPELRDKNFSDGLSQWVSSQPPEVARLEETLSGADWLVKEYKKHAGIQANATQARSNVTNNERPSAGGASLPGGQQRFSRSQIRELMRKNPAEYRRLEPAIFEARREGRIDDN